MNIYVGNLSWGMNDQDLENLFAEHGTVTSAKIITDRMTNRSRGFGFVEMSDGAEAAIDALQHALEPFALARQEYRIWAFLGRVQSIDLQLYQDYRLGCS